MILSRHQHQDGERWALDGFLLPATFDLRHLCRMPSTEVPGYLGGLATGEQAAGPGLAPIERDQEVWGCGVTYARSRDAREAETETKSIYDRVYEAERPELFGKSIGWRVRGPGQPIRVRRDSAWNVPEPELTLLVNRRGDILGYCAGNDVSSRSIEGENPLYLPQAKVYDGSCALGPGIRIAGAESIRDVPISLAIQRNGRIVYQGDTSSARIKRPLEELASFLIRELCFPDGAFLMTGTGIVPDQDFSLSAGDTVRIAVDSLVLENPVAC